MKVKYFEKVEKAFEHKEELKKQIASVGERYAFRANDYYLSLIDWNDPNDPIRKIIVPCVEELEEWGDWDASNEKRYTVLPGLEHKYGPTAVLIVSRICGGICRFCFRKRLFKTENEDVLTDLKGALDYINDHKEITNTLITGGDPFALSTSRLAALLDAVKPIKHLRYVRIGSKMPAFNPFRIIEDEELLKLLRDFNQYGKKLYIITHFNHPRELTAEAKAAVKLLHDTGATLSNQTPLLRGVNDDPATLAELLIKLAAAGVTPYYIFQNRPAIGNRAFAIPIEKGYCIFEEAKSLCSGLGKRGRYVMSHASGKLEITALTKEEIIFKYHEAADPKFTGTTLVFKRNLEAYWLDDYNMQEGESFHPRHMYIDESE